MRWDQSIIIQKEERRRKRIIWYNEMTTYQISSNQLTNYYSLSLLKNNTNQLTKTINKKYISYVILWFSLLSFIFIFDLIIFCFYWWLISVLSLSISLFSLFWFDFKMSSHNLEQKKKKNKMMKSEKESGLSHLSSHLPSLLPIMIWSDGSFSFG